jgi:hypothetical protein
MIAAFLMSISVICDACWLPKRRPTKVQVFRMICIVKDESCVKVTPFLNNGQGDSEFSCIDKTPSKARHRRPVELDIRSVADAFSTRNDFPFGRNNSHRRALDSEKPRP